MHFMNSDMKNRTKKGGSVLVEKNKDKIINNRSIVRAYVRTR
jgi:hypothetical protein